jgi:hypothetical protein
MMFKLFILNCTFAPLCYLKQFSLSPMYINEDKLVSLEDNQFREILRTFPRIQTKNDKCPLRQNDVQQFVMID